MLHSYVHLHLNHFNLEHFTRAVKCPSLIILSLFLLIQKKSGIPDLGLGFWLRMMCLLWTRWMRTEFTNKDFKAGNKNNIQYNQDEGSCYRPTNQHVQDSKENITRSLTSYDHPQCIWRQSKMSPARDDFTKTQERHHQTQLYGHGNKVGKHQSRCVNTGSKQSSSNPT